MTGAAAVLYVAFMWLWRFSIMGGCAYVVFWRGYSGWWFALAILLLGSYEIGTKGKAS